MATLLSKDTSGIFRQGPDEIELPKERTRNFKKFSLPDAPDGRKRYRIGGSVGPIHYRLDPFSQIEEYKEIDLDVVATPGKSWDAACETNGYQVRFWRTRVVNGRTIRYIAQFRRAGKWIAMAPIAVLWKNDLGEKQLISKTQDVGLPIIDNDNHWVTAKDAFGPGIDFRYNLKPDEFFKTVIVNHKSDLAPPTIGTDGLRLCVVMALCWHGDSKASNGFAETIIPDDFADITDEDDFDEQIENSERFSFRNELSRNIWWLQKPIAWDSYNPLDPNRSPHRTNLDWKIRRKGNHIFALLSVPASIFNATQVVYPVYIDTDITEEQVGASLDDGYSTGGNYDTRRTRDYLYFNDGNAGSLRGFVRFTTVPIPQGATINSATIEVWPYSADTDDPECTLYCEKSTDAPDLDDPETQLESRVLTAANQGWSDTGVAVGGFISSPDIKSCVEEIVGQGGWVLNNALAVIAVDTQSVKYFNIDQWDKDPSHAAKFNCSYTEAPSYIPELIMIH